MKKEEWKDIEGFENIYQISSFGNVKNVRTGRVLKHKFNNRKYHTIALYNNGKCEYKLIHRLVATAFIPNPEEKETVNHIDENKDNNRADNLEWLTHKENDNFGTRNERWLNTRRPYLNEIFNKVSLALTHGIVVQFDLDGKVIKEWNSVTEIERKLGYTRSSIQKRCKEKSIEPYKNYVWAYKSDLESRSDTAYFIAQNC